MLNYTDITQNTHIQSWMVTEILAREVWNFDSYYSLIDYQIRGLLEKYPTFGREKETGLLGALDT
jgi:hypothetical protein